MEKNVRLVNIYIKIHNKHALTMEDMSFLAKWDPECFAKTCQNLVYNLPETEELLRPAEETERSAEDLAAPDVPQTPVLSEQERIQNFLSNLKRLELNDLQVQDVSVDSVKNLMGNLFMEMMFPHNDKESYFYVQEQTSVFNKRV